MSKPKEELLFSIAVMGWEIKEINKKTNKIRSYSIKAYSLLEALGVGIEKFRRENGGYTLEVWDGKPIDDDHIVIIDRESGDIPREQNE